jgi:hypothetical protein
MDYCSVRSSGTVFTFSYSVLRRPEVSWKQIFPACAENRGVEVDYSSVETSGSLVETDFSRVRRKTGAWMSIIRVWRHLEASWQQIIPACAEKPGRGSRLFECGDVWKPRGNRFYPREMNNSNVRVAKSILRVVRTHLEVEYSRTEVDNSNCNVTGTLLQGA